MSRGSRRAHSLAHGRKGRELVLAPALPDTWHWRRAWGWGWGWGWGVAGRQWGCDGRPWCLSLPAVTRSCLPSPPGCLARTPNGDPGWCLPAGTSWKLLLAREEYADWWTSANRQWLGQINWRSTGSGGRKATGDTKKSGTAAAATAAPSKEELAFERVLKLAQSSGEAPAAAAAAEAGEAFGWEDEVITDLTDPVVQLEQQQEEMERQGKAEAPRWVWSKWVGVVRGGVGWAAL